MIQLKLPALVKAVRFRYGLLFVLLALVVYWTAITPWMTNWGATEAEQQMALPGDELQAAANEWSTLAISIDAPPDVVWQWLVQVGQDRAGFYTYTWLENLFGADIHNTNEIRPEWQHLDASAGWRLVPADYLWGLGEEALSPLLFVEPGRALVLEMWGAWVILPAGDNGSRLLVRGSSDQGNLLNRLLVAPIVFTMERRMLLGLQARAEGRPDAPAALMAVAQLGWIAAAVAVSALFLVGQRRRPWLLLPLLATLPALLTSGDVQAALAAFLASGITVLGFLFFGRAWWGSLLIIASLVLLTLLLAPEAYVALGLSFALIVLLALTALLVRRSGSPGRARRGLHAPAP